MDDYHFHDFIKNLNTINFRAGTEYQMDQLVDLKTGVNYLFAYDYSWVCKINPCLEKNWGCGYGYGYAGMTPRLNADGKPYVSSLSEIKEICRQYIRNSSKIVDGEYNFYLSDGLYQIVLQNNKFRTTIDAGKPVE